LAGPWFKSGRALRLGRGGALRRRSLRWGLSPVFLFLRGQATGPPNYPRLGCWQALCDGGFLCPPPAGTTASLSLPPRPASPCQRDAASEPAGPRSTEAAASAAKSFGVVGEPLGASLTLGGRSLPPEAGDIGAWREGSTSDSRPEAWGFRLPLPSFFAGHLPPPPLPTATSAPT
jgi:hypothetical protein